MHKVLSAASVGSVGDLARIARLLADRRVNIDAIGGGEAAVLGGTAGIVSMLVTSDDDDAELGSLLDALRELELDGGRTLADVRAYEALDVELDDRPGQLADAAGAVSDAGLNIMSVLSIDAHVNWAVVSMAFESVDDRETARQALQRAGFNVLGKHGGRKRRHRVSRVIAPVLRGDNEDDDD